MIRLLAACCAAAALSGCIAYNDDCQALIPHPEEVVGVIGEEIFLDKANARDANNAIGQLAADSFLHAQDGSANPPVFAAYNGGGIRADGVCVTRNILEPGALKAGVLHEILPFNNTVLVLTVGAADLRRVVERGLDGLVKAGTDITNPPGNFLQIAGGQLQVDCRKPGGDGCTFGPSGTCRLTGFQVSGADLLTAADDTQVRIALPNFLVTSGAGSADVLAKYLDNAHLGVSNPVQVVKQGGIDSDLAQDYMQTHDDGASPDRTLKVEQRIDFRDPVDGTPTCAVPPRPAG